MDWKKLMEKEIEIDIRVFGWISLIIGIVLLFSPIMFFSGLGLILPVGNPVVTSLMTFAFLYAAYKILYKKENFSKAEWIGWIFLLVLFFLPFVLLLFV